MDYNEALAYLDQHASYEKTGRIEAPSLDSIRRMMSAMGEPQLAAPAIHVTGTNGKGSTVQMITRLLMAQGLTVGTYTSPHLQHLNERIARSGEPIDDESFAEQIAAIADLEGLTGVRPSYFEACTAAAFRWFADVAVDVVVAEVGLLGRWDATNVLDAEVAVVTNIGMDHNEFAGPTLADIAREKAGIIKAGSAAVIGETSESLVEILMAEPAASRLRRDVDFEIVSNAVAVGGRQLDLRTPTTMYADLFLPLHGAHQGDNAVAALTAVETFFAAPLAADVVEQGLATVDVPGRFEVVGHQPLVIVDGAHNPAGADTCADVFFDDFAPEGSRTLVIGTLRDPEAMLGALRADEFDLVIAATAPSPRGVDAREVGAAAVALGAEEVLVVDTIRDACRMALDRADDASAVLVTGSLYVAGEAREALSELLP